MLEFNIIYIMRTWRDSGRRGLMDGSARAATPPPSVLVSSLKRPRVSLATGRAPVGRGRSLNGAAVAGLHRVIHLELRLRPRQEHQHAKSHYGNYPGPAVRVCCAS